MASVSTEATCLAAAAFSAATFSASALSCAAFSAVTASAAAFSAAIFSSAARYAPHGADDRRDEERLLLFLYDWRCGRRSGRRRPRGAHRARDGDSRLRVRLGGGFARLLLLLQFRQRRRLARALLGFALGL